MELKNEFDVDAPPSDVWELLLDLERVIPCMPGATFLGWDGDDLQGRLEVRVGPISAAFEGVASFVEQDADARRAVIAATGRDPRGQSTAAAQVTARLEPLDEGRTRVLLDTRLDISGRLAQFGRGALADLSARLIGQFADNLHEQLLGPLGTGGPESVEPAPPTVASPRGQSPTSGELDLLSVIGPVLRERLTAPATLATLGLLAGILLGRLTRRPPSTRGCQPSVVAVVLPPPAVLPGGESRPTSQSK